MVFSAKSRNSVGTSSFGSIMGAILLFACELPHFAGGGELNDSAGRVRSRPPGRVLHGDRAEMRFPESRAFRARFPRCLRRAAIQDIEEIEAAARLLRDAVPRRRPL